MRREESPIGAAKGRAPGKLPVGLISCVSKKLERPAAASDLYISDWFRKSRGYAEDHYDIWFVLSAEYSLVDPDQTIEPYNKTLNEMPTRDRRRWAEDVFQAVRNRLSTPERYEVFIHAGRRYREYLIPLLENVTFSVKVPLKGLRIGEQLSWYKKRGY